VDVLVGRISRLLPDAELEVGLGWVEFRSGDERGFIVRVGPEGVGIRLPTVVWQGVHTPVSSSRPWRTLDAAEPTDAVITGAIAEAMAARAAEFVACFHCGRPTPPEHRHGDTCHACAERYLGVVH